jgi:hypothetical protein
MPNKTFVMLNIRLHSTNKFLLSLAVLPLLCLWCLYGQRCFSSPIKALSRNLCLQDGTFALSYLGEKHLCEL